MEFKVIILIIATLVVEASNSGDEVCVCVGVCRWVGA